MLHRSHPFVVLPFVLAVAAAQDSPPPRVVPYPIDLPDAFQRAIDAGTRTTNGRPGNKHWTNHARYRLEAELDPQAARLTGRAVMTYENRSPRRISQLVVHLYQDLMRGGAQRTRTVEPTNGFEIGSVTMNGKDVGQRRVDDTRMIVPLAERLQPGAELTLEIEWAFDVPKATTAPRMGHEKEDVFYLGYWYPQFAVCDDVEGWIADPYRGNGEFYMDYADYELAITVPAGYLVSATGELQNAADVLTAKARERLATAATTRDVVHVIDAADLKAGEATAAAPGGKLTWRFRAENVRDAAVSIARTYLWDATHAVVKDKDGPGKDGTCMINAVYEPRSGDWVRGAEYARHTIEYMSAHVFPYPWPHMTACEGVIRGGMEYPMMTIIGGTPRPADTIMHELIHMWFPMLVGSNEKRCAWQDEGFTSFWTTLCQDDFMKRTTGPQGDILREYIRTIARSGDAACMRHADAYGQDDFGFASYGKPAAVLHQLRALLGDETFFAAFRRYTADWAWKHPYPYDFFRTFSDVAGQDLDPYFRTWLYETWRLEHAIGGVDAADGKTVVTIEDRGRAMHPCVVEATRADGSKERQTVPVATWRTSARAVLTFDGDVVAVKIDPDVQSLDFDRKNNDWSKAR